jgi:hypothetical protein
MYWPCNASYLNQRDAGRQRMTIVKLLAKYLVLSFVSRYLLLELANTTLKFHGVMVAVADPSDRTV